ncbi:MAG: FecR domain-containing protein [Bacteroidales bacterium]|nr:FecR domain-containing protein [Bacteroidales bacterium]
MEDKFAEENLNLIIRNLNGTATLEESQALEDWIESSAHNQTTYVQMKNIWEISDRQFKPEEIDVDRALSRVLKIISTSEKAQRTLWFRLQKIAAIMLLPLMLTGYFIGRGISDHLQINRQVTYHEVFVPFGTRSNLVLSDGSIVWLNSGSKLKYPGQFENVRKVFLEGEGYFEVESDTKHPFIVETRTLNIEATGTKFNVSAGENDSRIEITLLEGKIEVNKNDEAKATAFISDLQPNQHMTYDMLTGDFHLLNQNTDKYIAWKDGKLIFRNDQMIDVVKKIGQYYNVEIELRDNELMSYRYRATFENESFDEVMKLLKLSSPIDYVELERDTLPDGTFTKRKVIIFKKK